MNLSSMLCGCLAFGLLVDGKAQSGFISIDCGIPEGSDYTDEVTKISYTSDARYVDTGTNHNISFYYHSAAAASQQLYYLRSFPKGIKNCYTIKLAQADQEFTPVTARLLKAKNDENIRAAYRVPLQERYAHALLEYEPTYTSYLQQRKKKSKEQLAAERAGPSRKRKRSSVKGKSIDPVEVSSDSEFDLHRARIQDLIGKIREPLAEEFEEEEVEMGGNLGDLPSLIPSKKTKKSVAPSAKGAPSQSKRAPVTPEADQAELKKQRLVLGSGSGKDVQKGKDIADKRLSEKDVTEKDAPPKGSNAEASPSVPFIFTPQTKQGQPVLLTDSVRANPRLGLPLLQGVCLPEDMKQLPSDLEGNIVDMFSHLTLANQSILGYHQKVVNLSSSFSNLKLKYRDSVSKKKEAENELAAAKLQLSELDEVKKQLSELDELRGQVKTLQQKLSEEEERSKKAVSVAHSAGFEEAKLKVVEHYQGQVAEIKNMGFRRGAEIYFFKGVAKGYELGLEAGSVPAESALRAVPAVETPEIEIPSEEEEDGEEEESPENVAEGDEQNTENVNADNQTEAANQELGKDA